MEIYIYHNNDPKYCKEELNYKKKPNVVIMKSNIAECEKRTKFLLNFLPRLIEEGRHVLLLSCRREHIFQMEKMINAMEIPDCTVGLYLGGMKQENLDISATKRVIIATFNMAEEAFDCKTLNTLVFATPHNNIEQAVGRILREEKKKRKLIPLIIDLQDTFSSFAKWNKLREKYYKTKGYPMKVYDVDDTIKQSTPVITFIKDITADSKTVKHSSKTSSKTGGKHKGGKKKHNETAAEDNDDVDDNDDDENNNEAEIEF